MQFSWRQHWPLLLVPIGFLLMFLAFCMMLNLDDESSWNDAGELELEYYEGE